MLRNNGLIDSSNRWQAGTTHLVSLGDLLDRGPDSRAVMDLLRDLQPQALAAGGRVHVLLGNHEAMNLVGDLRDVSTAEFAAFASTDRDSDRQDDLLAEQPRGYLQHRAAFAANGSYGRWLLSLPAIVRINRTLFVHGGLPPLVAQRGLQELNHSVRAALADAAAVQDPEAPLAPVLDNAGPLWYRGSAQCHPLLEQTTLDAALSALNADRVIIGHTPTATRRIQRRLDGRVYAIDTGMLKAVYRGEAFALELQGDVARALTASGEITEVAWFDSILLVPPALEAALGQWVRRQSLVTTETGRVKVSIAKGASAGRPTASLAKHIAALRDNLVGDFVAATHKQTQRAIAAWRLDRLLNVHMVPLTLAHTHNNKQGYLLLTQGRWITEAARLERELQRPNYCANGHAYEIVRAYDALIGNNSRSRESLSYRVGTWAIRLTQLHKGFDTHKRLPEYAQPPVLPPALAARFAALSAASLAEHLGELLTRRQRNALLQRRDQILDWQAQPTAAAAL